MSKRFRILAEAIFAAGALAVAPLSFAAAAKPVVHVVGTVTQVIDGECQVRYADRGGTVHTYSNYGGKYGCGDKVGDATDLYYPPNDPGNPDTVSPLENLLGGLLMLGIAAFSGGNAILQVRAGAWTGGWRHRPPRHRRTGGRRWRSRSQED